MNSQRDPIYCIGDSHVSFFSGSDLMMPTWPARQEKGLPFFHAYRLGPVLAYNLCQTRAASRGRERLFKVLRREVPLGSRVMLCFGEIDCRAHLLKQAILQARDLESVVAECVARYTSVAREVIGLGYEVLLWNVPASTIEDKLTCQEFPVSGTCAERNRAALIFNQRLAAWCDANGAKFISIFESLIDERGATRLELYADSIHLSQKAMPLAIAKLQEALPEMDFSLQPRWAAVTPSRIATAQRMKFAQDSLASFKQSLTKAYHHVVVDDLPWSSGYLTRILPNPKAWCLAPKVYREQNITLIRRFWGRGSRGALLKAVQEARRQGADLVFIHLDDNVYLPLMGKLLNHARDAFARNKDLAEVRLSDYPIICRTCTTKLGNRTHLRIRPEEITFDRVRLQPDQQPEYTLWWAEFDAGMVEQDYWPIAMWQSLYRAEYLEKLLTLPGIAQLRHLNQVELYCKAPETWRRVLQSLPGRMGYINMQFGGLEMERNENWGDLLALPNEEVR